MTKSNPLEKAVTKKIRDHLKSFDDVWHFKHHGHVMSQAGIPDIIGCTRGEFFAIEVKRITGAVTELQEHTLREIIIRGGGFSMVAYGFDDFKLKFDKFYKEVHNATENQNRREEGDNDSKLD